MSAPCVSVVIATYNSSHLLRYAISSLRLSDFEAWELLVVGDHCTDDTQECVASFGDARIRFTNLDRNSGQQATPNNVGVAAARGEYIAFLNQDDMYLPFHLSRCVEGIRSTGADILCTAYAVIDADQVHHIAERRVVAGAGGWERKFNPRKGRIASSWLLRREVAEAVGPWRLENQTFVTPSQEWLFRAWRSGKRIYCNGEISVVALPSGVRRDSYRRQESPEHEFVFREIVETARLRGQMLDAIAAWHEARKLRLRQRGPSERARRSLRCLVRRALLLLGIHPNTFMMIRGWGGRGAYLRALKKTTG